MQLSELNTADLPADEQIPAWEQFNAHHMVQLTCHTIEPRLHGHQRCVSLPSLRGVRIQADSHTIFRSRAQVDHSPNETVQISTVEGGKLFFQDEYGMTPVDEGSMLILDTDVPYSITFGSHLTMQSLLVPKSLVKTLSPALLTDNKTVMPSTDAVEAAQLAVFSGEQIDPTRLIRSLGRPSPMDDLFHEASDLLAKRFTEPGMTVGMIAADLHVSERQLARVFAARDTTASREMLKLRLSGAAEDLVNPALSYLKINEVFHRNGFSSPSNAHRRFVECFGTTPGQFRNFES